MAEEIRRADKRAELLALWLADETLVPEADPSDAAYVAPRTAVEHTLADLLASVLEVAPVGIDDDYFRLGGDSVHAVVIIARLRAAGWQLMAQDLLDHRTIRAVADLVEPIDSHPEPAAGEPVQDLPLGPMQQGMLYHSVGGSSPGAYVVQVDCVLRGPLDEAAFALAWRRVVAAHPALRVGFGFADGAAPRQAVRETVELALEFVDHRGMEEAQRAAELSRFLDADRDRGFDLSAPPLLRLTVFRESERVRRCVWTHHHLILDGWSQQLVLRDVFECYDAALRDVAVQVPRRADFSDYLRWYAHRDPDRDERYWRGRLADLAGPTPIAGPGCVDGRVVAVRREEAVLRIPDELAAAVRARCRETGATFAAAVIGGWGLLLGALHERRDVVFGVTVSGRPAQVPGANDMVGMFVNTLPLRLGFTDATAVRDWPARTGAGIGELVEHQQVPLSWVERAAGGGRSGLFDSIVVVENFPPRIDIDAPSARLRVSAVRAHIDEGYPLVLEVAVRPTPVLRVRYDPARLTRARVETLLAALLDYSQTFAAEPNTSLGALTDRMSERLTRQRDDAVAARRERSLQGLATARRRVAASLTPGSEGKR
ncbi:condensation domain-containing protein [Nocardia sp. NPDC047038]|uniref:condensation domain-containing protein n=1 Tax=Nocardia sp. NPDC047038 TaxID=3154338 RepID=UPI0033CAEE3F